jgi:hypothetical protein
VQPQTVQKAQKAQKEGKPQEKDEAGGDESTGLCLMSALQRDSIRGIAVQAL